MRETLASAIHVIGVRDVFLLKHLPNLAVGTQRDRMIPRQFHRRLPHSLPCRRGFILQHAAQALGNQVAQLRTTLYGRDLSPLG